MFARRNRIGRSATGSSSVKATRARRCTQHWPNAASLTWRKLKTHYANGSRLSGHVSHKGIPGVEFSTGSLGHGLAVASGMALAAKMDGKQHRVYCILGDGECDEGEVWEAALIAHQFKLDHPCRRDRP